MDPSYIYGIGDNNVIYQINPAPGQQSFGSVYSTGLSGNPNAFAFDRVRDQMFFISPSGTFGGTPYTNGLFLWNKPAGTFALIDANGANYGAGGTIPANAAYHDDAFWFFNERTLDLNKATLSYSGTGSAAVPTGISGTQRFTINTSGLLTVSANAFGDIAINVDTNTLYGYTAAGQGGAFYALSLAAPTEAGSFTMISASSAVGLQISFNEDYTVLYGHNYQGGAWYSIDTTNGGLTDLNFATTTNGSTGFRDIGGASIQAIPEPGTIPLMAAGALSLVAWGFVRHPTRRRRIRPEHRARPAQGLADRHGAGVECRHVEAGAHLQHLER